jgi:hypothetical protein
MEPSSRTPEGVPNRCPVCGKRVRLEPSTPPGDAPCPHCGHLLWFQLPEGKGDSSSGQVDRSARVSGESPSDFTLDDFRRMLGQVRRLGSLEKITGLIPGLGSPTAGLENADPEREMKRLAGIVDSMTPDERRRPNLIEPRRRKRIAVGAGVEPHEVEELIKEFEAMQRVMGQMQHM